MGEGVGGVPANGVAWRPRGVSRTWMDGPAGHRRHVKLRRFDHMENSYFLPVSMRVDTSFAPPIILYSAVSNHGTTTLGIVPYP